MTTAATTTTTPIATTAATIETGSGGARRSTASAAAGDETTRRPTKALTRIPGAGGGRGARRRRRGGNGAGAATRAIAATKAKGATTGSPRFSTTTTRKNRGFTDGPIYPHPLPRREEPSKMPSSRHFRCCPTIPVVPSRAERRHKKGWASSFSSGGCARRKKRGSVRYPSANHLRTTVYRWQSAPGCKGIAGARLENGCDAAPNGRNGNKIGKLGVPWTS
mmetsp:Transcript_16079/g.37278  ORF Transcript_16079/g.37278 Transcript_16079/m.37278 type:complete len:221 (+) Transcript_16079:899-1561(+)